MQKVRTAVAVGIVLSFGVAHFLGATPAEAPEETTALRADDEANLISGIDSRYMRSADDGKHWKQAVAEDRFPGNQKIVVAPRDDEWIASVPYDPTVAYKEGACVSWGESLWVNQWWANPGETPGSNPSLWKRLPVATPSISGQFAFNPHKGEQADDFQRHERRYANAKKRVASHFPEWGVYAAHDYFTPSKIPWGKITHLMYGFGVFQQVNGEWGIQTKDTWAANNLLLGDRWSRH